MVTGFMGSTVSNEVLFLDLQNLYNFSCLESGDGTVVRVLPSQCGTGLIIPQCYMWVELVVGSCLALRFLSRFLGLPSSTKTNISKFQFKVEDPHENQQRMMWLSL